MTTARIFGIYISPGGVPKLPIEKARVTELGIEGDKHRSLKYHGGPQRALCLYSREVMQRLQDEGHPIMPGSTGENVLIAGLNWNTVVPGSRLRLGSEVRIEIASYTTPCRNIAASFQNEFFNRIHHRKSPGESRLYARVLQCGVLNIGDSVAVERDD